jgi:protoheme IX farnesyltransferase
LRLPSGLPGISGCTGTHSAFRDYFFNAPGPTSLAQTRFATIAIFQRCGSGCASTSKKLGDLLEMATEPILAALDFPTVQHRYGLARSGVLSAYWSLTKPEVNFLIAVTAAAGFWMGTPASFAHFPWAHLVHTLVGTALVASGAATLNQRIELRFDAQMRRTARRPLVSGRIEPAHALWFGISLSFIGAMYLAVTTNVLASLLAILTLLAYLFLYTPLKRKTPLCTLIGALPGATPPLIGWAAACGRLDGHAWLLFAIVFLWQFPHVMAIAWMYREDYARAGYVVLPTGESRDRLVAWQTLLPSLALLAVAFVPAIRGESRIVCLAGALVLGSAFLCYSARFAFRRSTVSARQLLFASILYLPVLFALLAFDTK